MSEHATFEPEQGLSHTRYLKIITGDDGWKDREDHPDWVAIENEDGERVYIYASHTLHLGPLCNTVESVSALT